MNWENDHENQEKQENQVIDQTSGQGIQIIPGIKTDKGWKILFAVILILFLISLDLNWKMSQKIDRIQLQVDQGQQMLMNQISSINGQISSIPANVDESLKKEASIIADYGYQVQSDQIDRKTRTVPIRMTVRPKEDKDGLITTFLIETQDGKIITATGEKGEANTYIAQANVPMVDYLKLGVTFDDGTTQKSEKLEELYQPFGNMIMKVDSVGNWSGLSQMSDEIRYSGTVETTITQSADGKNYPIKAIVQVLKNGKLKNTIPIAIETASGTSAQTLDETAVAADMMGGTCITYYTQFNETFKLKPNDSLEIRVVVEDNYGLRYTQVIDGEMIDKDGNMNSMNYSGEVVVE